MLDTFVRFYIQGNMNISLVLLFTFIVTSMVANFYFLTFVKMLKYSID
jgi:hypothetical protein